MPPYCRLATATDETATFIKHQKLSTMQTQTATQQVLTPAQVIEFNILKSQLFGESMFVIPDNTNPKWDRYNELMAIRLNERRAANIARLSINAQHYINDVWRECKEVIVSTIYKNDPAYLAITELTNKGFARCIGYDRSTGFAKYQVN